MWMGHGLWAFACGARGVLQQRQVLGAGRHIERGAVSAKIVDERIVRQHRASADHLARPETVFPCDPLQPHDGWCDAPGDPHYNEQVRLPYPGRHERLWRDEEIYDCIAVLGYNDAPARAGAGSAIFLHVARQDLAPTEGCVALPRGDLLEFLRAAEPLSRVCVALP